MNYNFTEHFIIVAKNISFHIITVYNNSFRLVLVIVCVRLYLYSIFICLWVSGYGSNANIRIFLLSPVPQRAYIPRLFLLSTDRQKIAIKITLRYSPLTLDNEHRLVVVFFFIHVLFVTLNISQFSSFKCSLLNKLSWCHITLLVPLSLCSFATVGVWVRSLSEESVSIGIGGFTINSRSQM